MRRHTVKLLGVALAIIAGDQSCSSARRFRAVCESIEPGERVIDVAGRLEAAGGGYVGKVEREYHWTRGKWFMTTANCLVEDDQPPARGAPDRHKKPPPDARVIGVRYVEGEDLF